MAELTLIHGDAKKTFDDHPTEIARRALMAAAEVETGRWPFLLRQCASSLPEREPIVKGGG